MNYAPFAIDELEVDVLEPRHEMAQLPPSTCMVSTCVTVHPKVPSITPPPSTCMPLN